MSKQAIGPHVDRYMEDIPVGRSIYIEDLEAFIRKQNGTTDVRRGSVQTHMYHRKDVVVKHRGRVWTRVAVEAVEASVPEQRKAELYEKIDDLANGGILLKSADGSFYRGVPL